MLNKNASNATAANAINIAVAAGWNHREAAAGVVVAVEDGRGVAIASKTHFGTGEMTFHAMRMEWAFALAEESIAAAMSALRMVQADEVNLYLPGFDMEDAAFVDGLLRSHPGILRTATGTAASDRARITVRSHACGVEAVDEANHRLACLIADQDEPIPPYAYGECGAGPVCPDSVQASQDVSRRDFDLFVTVK